MKCPYFCNTKQVKTTTSEYDAEGHETNCKTIFGEKQHLAECSKEECGAWHDGCHYKNG